MSVDDAFLVRRLQGFGDLHEAGKSFVYRNPTSLEPFGQRFAFHELHHQKSNAVRFFQTMNRGDIGMVQRSKKPRLTLEAGQALAICVNASGRTFVATSRFSVVSVAR
jgi:hypothetical protein